MKKLLTLALHLTKGIGYSTYQRLLQNYGSLEVFFKERKDKINLKKAEEELKEAQKRGIEIITIEEPEYPKELLAAPSPPLAIYVWGTIPRKPSIAVVGSRKCSEYGRRIAYSIGKKISENGGVVVSGLALGIDSAAHRGALNYPSSTVAVLGSGLLSIYPSSNHSLAQEIVEKGGGVISEFPLKTRARKEFFPRRNRLISALSAAVIVVEAREKSGALITVDFALEMGKDVIAVPGNIDTPYSKGSNRLIKEGAIPLTCIEEILEIFPELKKPNKKEEKRAEQFGEVYEALKEGPLSPDEIASKLNKPVSFINSALSYLEIQKLVKREGLKWSIL